jgi:phosphate/sulfate permease
MAYLVIALLGAACGALLSWYLLIPVVTLVAIAAGVAGAIKGHSLGGVLLDSALMVCVLEVSWLASVFAAARLVHRKAKFEPRAERSTDREHRPPEYEG